MLPMLLKHEDLDLDLILKETIKASVECNVKRSSRATKSARNMLVNESRETWRPKMLLKQVTEKYKATVHMYLSIHDPHDRRHARSATWM